MTTYRPLPSGLALDLELLAADLSELNAQIYERTSFVAVLVPDDTTTVRPDWQDAIGFLQQLPEPGADPRDGEYFAVMPQVGPNPFRLDTDLGADFALAVETSEAEETLEALGYHVHCLAHAEHPTREIRVHVWNGPTRLREYRVLPRLFA